MARQMPSRIPFWIGEGTRLHHEEILQYLRLILFTFTVKKNVIFANSFKNSQKLINDEASAFVSSFLN